MANAPPLPTSFFPGAPWGPRVALASFGLAIASVGAGCDGCHRDRPYTPFRIGADDAGGGVASAHPTQPDAGAGTLPPAISAVATTPAGDGRAWALAPGRTVAAPAGRTFTRGIVIDADGDGTADLLAFAHTLEGDDGSLFFASGAEKDAPPVEIVGGPPPAPAPGICKVHASMSQVGSRTVLLDVARPCGPQPGRWLTLVRLADPGPKPVRPTVALEVAVRPTDAPIDLAVEAADRDGDGRDDPSVTATLGGAPPPFPAAPAAKAAVRFLDRPAGLARDPSEPEASMAALAAKLVDDARRKATAKDVAAAAAQLRRLHAALCAEDGEAPVTFSAAGRLTCGPARSLEEATFAEGLAGITLGEPLRAAGALARLEARAPAGEAGAGKGSGRRRELEKLLAKATPTVTGKEIFHSAATPDASMTGAPAWIPLAFEASGDLLVRTTGGVTRVRTAGGFTEEDAPETRPWPASLALPTKAGDATAASERPRLASIAQRCGGPWLTALFESASSKQELPLPIATPVGPSGLPAALCASLASVPVVPLDGGSPLRFGVGSEVVEISASERGTTATSVSLDAAAARTVGSARSPDGRVAALPLPGGVLVMSDLGKAKPGAARWTGPDLAKAWSCTPANGGRRIACVTSAGAAIYEAR